MPASHQLANGSRGVELCAAPAGEVGGTWSDSFELIPAAQGGSNPAICLWAAGEGRRGKPWLFLGMWSSRKCSGASPGRAASGEGGLFSSMETKCFAKRNFSPSMLLLAPVFLPSFPGGSRTAWPTSGAALLVTPPWAAVAPCKTGLKGGAASWRGTRCLPTAASPEPQQFWQRRKVPSCGLHPLLSRAGQRGCLHLCWWCCGEGRGHHGDAVGSLRVQDGCTSRRARLRQALCEGTRLSSLV